MSGLFQQINGNITEEQVMEIVQTGQVPSHLKTAEDKVYYVIFRNYMFDIKSNVADATYIDGEAIIAVGRLNVFRKIKEYLDNDGERSTDVRKSFVMVEGVDAGKSVSLYRFIKLCNKKYTDEAFDEDELEAYISGFNDEQEFRQRETTGLGGNAGTMMNEEV